MWNLSLAMMMTSCAMLSDDKFSGFCNFNLQVSWIPVSSYVIVAVVSGTLPVVNPGMQ